MEVSVFRGRVVLHAHTLAMVIQAMIIRAPTMKPSLQPSRIKSSGVAFARQLPPPVATPPGVVEVSFDRRVREGTDSVWEGGAILYQMRSNNCVGNGFATRSRWRRTWPIVVPFECAKSDVDMGPSRIVQRVDYRSRRLNSAGQSLEVSLERRIEVSE